MSTEHCYVEFELADHQRRKRLAEIVETIRSDIATKALDTDRSWHSMFRESELAQFWWPNEKQLQDVRARWGDVPIRTVTRSPNEQEEWDIYSMFEVISTSEYELLGVRFLDESTGRIEFAPWAYPFGGTEALQKLARVLGATIMAVDDGTGVNAPGSRVDELSTPEVLLWLLGLALLIVALISVFRGCIGLQ